MSNTTSLYSGGLDENTKTIAFEVLCFLFFGGGMRGVYKWFKTSNFMVKITVNKGKCGFDCKSADAEEPAIQPQVEITENNL